MSTMCSKCYGLILQPGEAYGVNPNVLCPGHNSPLSKTAGTQGTPKLALTAHPKKSESIEDEPTTRLKMAKILKDYKDDTVDYIRTAQALEALYNQRILDARFDELEWAHTRSPAGRLSDIDYNERIEQLKRTRAGINKKEDK